MTVLEKKTKLNYTYILIRVFAPLINLLVFCLNVFVPRNRKIILFGSWMGKKFADNTRFFFQYLSARKQQYDIEKTIWVTRDKEIYSLLRSYDYEVYMMHSWKSFYYHIKAGVHCVCNLSYQVKGYDGDIMGALSGNALKIDMSHGVAIKAGKTTGENSTKEGFIAKIKYKLRKNKVFNDLFTPGHWNKAYHLSTGKECSRRGALFYGVDEKWFLESGYPRNCVFTKLFPNETIYLNTFEKYNKVILYAPTFRENGDAPHPLNDIKLQEYLKSNNYLWVEKPHPAEKNHTKIEGMNFNSLYLPSEFDVNIIIPSVSLVISDYSSIVYDAIAFSIPVLFYAPDYKHYLNDERGFLCNYKELTKGFYTEEIDLLIKMIDMAFNDEEYQEKLIRKIKAEKRNVLEANKENNDQIADYLHEKLGII